MIDKKCPDRAKKIIDYSLTVGNVLINAYGGATTIPPLVDLFSKVANDTGLSDYINNSSVGDFVNGKFGKCLGFIPYVAKIALSQRRIQSAIEMVGTAVGAKYGEKFGKYFSESLYNCCSRIGSQDNREMEIVEDLEAGPGIQEDRPEGNNNEELKEIIVHSIPDKKERAPKEKLQEIEIIVHNTNPSEKPKDRIKTIGSKKLLPEEGKGFDLQ